VCNQQLFFKLGFRDKRASVGSKKELTPLKKPVVEEKRPFCVININLGSKEEQLRVLFFVIVY
jgi:hypothetical protein